MEADAAVEEFVTIVPVGENSTVVQDPEFVTVLNVSVTKGGAEVIVNRPRGARLGLGLKFEGGSAATEKVRRLLVQSCAEDSPAANACTPWGKLISGDEILAIDGTPVSELTRIECVRRLKDSDESLILLVRHFETLDKVDQQNMETKETVMTDSKTFVDISRPLTLPPPVPPRKLGKKNSFKDKTTLQTVGEQNALMNLNLSDTGNDKDSIISALVHQHSMVSTMNKLSRKSSFDSHIHRQTKESFAHLKKGSPEEVRRLVRRLSDGKTIPPEAEVYIDLLSNEWERCLVLADAESDDTGSSISTVVDRLGSMASSVENSIPSTPVMQQKSIDIQKVLNSIENIDSDILKDMTNVKYSETKVDRNDDLKRCLRNSMTNGQKVSNTNSNIVTENIKPKQCENDNNNNETSKTLAPNDTFAINDKKMKEDVVLDKPKPMPRSTKVERSASEKKRRPVPIPEVQPPNISEPLLTPTKKTCIESWLQRSEAEMQNTSTEKIEETTIPEALPRLIDFVPKNQYKEKSNESPTCVRPTTAPPPPPVPPPETREDGSGASLDTIGELDETCDVVDNAKQTKDIETNKRKSLYERNFWDDRVNRSDAEDKSLSNDETPLPSCPRQPPDGVETPSDVVEKVPDLPTRLPPTTWISTRSRYSYASRTQDARSEASVKDKIAMFSVDLAASSDRLDKCGTLPVRSHSTVRKNAPSFKNDYTEISSLDRRLTKSQDNLDETPRSYKRNLDRPEVLGALENSHIEKKGYRSKPSDMFGKPLFYGSTTTLPTNISSNKSIYHARSISDDNSNKNSASHKSNLEYLIEQRKKSMSKLRGLVIPEVQAPIVDLPEIKVKDPPPKTLLHNFSQIQTTKESKSGSKNPLFVSENKWNTSFLTNNIPKYSPAFKRKFLQVYTPSLSKETTPERKLPSKVDTNERIINNYNNSFSSKPARITQEYPKPTNKSTQLLNKEFYKINSNDKNNDFKNYEIRICTTTDVVDSDNDSAMSSTQSSYRSSASSPMHNMDHLESDSSRLSPKLSHYNTYSIVKTEIPNKLLPISQKNYEEYSKRKVCRSMSSDTNISLSSSAGSAATSGSQASCSSLESSVADSDKRKVSTIYNVDTINRRNIVASSKCRSGRDVTLTSPVIETKFSHESYNRSPSPTHKPSDRLSTLTSTVSAVANKGENRRRNKKIVSDSDSDNEENIRQRKPDYKNTRLKRNSSTTNKNNKYSDNVQVTEVIEKESVLKEKVSKGKDCNNEIQDNQKDLDKNKSELINTTGLTKIEKDKEKRNGITPKKDVPVKLQNVKPVSIPVINSNNVQEKPVKVTTQVIRLIKGAGSGVGLILAGGIDCEAKDVTVHRVLEDSIAAKAGIKRGSKIQSINGNAMSGMTHAQSVKVLKEQRSEVIIEIELPDNRNLKDCGSQHSESKGQQGMDGTKFRNNSGRSIVTVILEKAGGGAGLGFGLDGGRDSPQGDKPLTIKKLFAGGAAAQSGKVLVGAELLSAGGQAMEGFTRTQAWAALKALPAGQVTLVLRNP
ncbi:uncharacterized protein LOC116779110 [Danaus plexippus]|uniref:uncharacterized protein LOC116779110 n=1 Tax=Danaus plexippus TaxID=13037 RepID=UPI002AB02C67|nr:uncharacterized protein LOC116779110 [Danaus plexippus]